MPWRNAPFASDRLPLPTLRIHPFELKDDVCALAVHGELDLSSTGLLEDALTECIHRGCPRLILDLSPLRFIDCTGVDLLTSFRRTLPDGHSLVLAEPHPVVRDTLALTNLARVCDIFERLDDALAHWSSPGFVDSRALAVRKLRKDGLHAENAPTVSA